MLLCRGIIDIISLVLFFVFLATLYLLLATIDIDDVEKPKKTIGGT